MGMKVLLGKQAIVLPCGELRSKGKSPLLEKAAGEGMRPGELLLEFECDDAGLGALEAGGFNGLLGSGDEDGVSSKHFGVTHGAAGSELKFETHNTADLHAAG
jgi:hypothetical protein